MFVTAWAYAIISSPDIYYDMEMLALSVSQRDWLGAGLDLVGILLPGIPTVGKAVSETVTGIGKASDEVSDVIGAVAKNADNVSDAAKALDTRVANTVIENTDEAIDSLGGAYKDVPANGGQVHHMPADSVSPFSKGDGPGIRMETADHMSTASWGRSEAATQYRAAQKELISQGNFKAAQQMDIVDIQNQFGNKYNAGIQQMLDYTDKLIE